MENFGKFMAIVMLFICQIILQFILTEIVISISVLYGLTFITQYTFAQIFGTLLIIKMVKNKYVETDDEDKDLGYAFKVESKGLLNNLFFYLIVWGISFGVYHFWFY